MLKSSHRILENFPWLVVGAAFAICVFSAINLSSAAQTANMDVHLLQLAWFGLGIITATIIALVDYRLYNRLAYYFLGFIVIMLIAVLVIGKVRMGAQRWLAFGPVTIQPSELLKLGVVLALAKYFSGVSAAPPYGLRQLIIPIFIVFIPVLPVLKQPDLGTSLTIIAIGFSVILFIGVRLRILLFGAVIGASVAVAGWFTFLKDYQKKRILSFLNPESDALGAGYHANQSIIAVGSGQMYGKGWGQGTQTQLSFLPEQHTDFVFSVWAEEWGFMGGLFIIALYLILLISILAVVIEAKDRFGRLVVVGCSAIIFWQMLINISMVIGLMPVVGITLPLFSYGGSSVLTVFCSIGLVINISLRKYLF